MPAAGRFAAENRQKPRLDLLAQGRGHVAANQHVRLLQGRAALADRQGLGEKARNFPVETMLALSFFICERFGESAEFIALSIWAVESDVRRICHSSAA